MFLYAPAADSLAATPSVSVWQGNLLGSPTNRPGKDASTFGPGVLKSPSQSSIIFSAAESYFLQAEAALRGYTDVDPGTLYNQGVTASFEYLNAVGYGQTTPDATATQYENQPSNINTNFAATTGFAQQLGVIIRQKWMAMNMVTPFEAWCDYRRTGLPANIPLSVSPSVDVLAIPLRILYPISEYTTNTANVNAQGTIDHHTSKIFWMP